MARRKHGHVIVDLINELDFKKFVEIGICRCRNMSFILQNTNLSEYWAIDPWVVFDGCYGTFKGIPQENWDSWYAKACRHMLYYPQLRVIRATSILAANMFPNGYLDFVYIDGDHTYEAVKDDINAWLPKVRKGGIIGGHDYNHRRIPGVKQAVDELFSEVELDCHNVWFKRL